MTGSALAQHPPSPETMMNMLGLPCLALASLASTLNGTALAQTPPGPEMTQNVLGAALAGTRPILKRRKMW